MEMNSSKSAAEPQAPTNEQIKRALEEEENEPSKRLCSENDHKTIREKLPKKKKFALLLGYCGKNYYGMQVNNGWKTVEGALLEALYKAGLVSIQRSEELYQIKFQRAARTDKGVSAACQVVSLLLPEGYAAHHINSHLPDDIRVFSMKRVTKGFDSKINCVARTYSYTLPTYILSQHEISKFSEDYRIPQETIKKVNDLLSTYIGSHNFHNFTSKKLYGDPSAKRYIMSSNCESPFVYGIEFITLKIKGQSFMLHQIRKMVGAVILILRGLVPPDFITASFKAEKTRIPKAPGSGLLLESIHYDKYNNRYGSDGIHDDLTWSDVREEVENFRRDKIMRSMLEDQINDQIMLKWMEEIELYHSEIKDESALQDGIENHDGEIPLNVPEKAAVS